MRKITKQLCGAFLDRKAKHIGNTMTDGNALFLFGNKIAEHRPDGIYATLAGWPTATTIERLRGLNCAAFCKQAGVAHFRGKPIDSHEWVKLT